MVTRYITSTPILGVDVEMLAVVVGETPVSEDEVWQTFETTKCFR